MSISTRFDDPIVIEDISRKFKSFNSGVGYIVEAYLAMEKRVLAGLKGRFKERELKVIIDMLNGMILSPQLCSTEVLASSVSDACLYDKLDEKWSIDKKTLLEKISKLSFPESLYLQAFCKEYWLAKDKEGFIETLL